MSEISFDMGPFTNVLKFGKLILGNWFWRNQFRDDSARVLVVFGYSVSDFMFKGLCKLYDNKATLQIVTSLIIHMSYIHFVNLINHKI